jgi:HD-like signal output (HDOD) protein
MGVVGHCREKGSVVFQDETRGENSGRPADTPGTPLSEDVRHDGRCAYERDRRLVATVSETVATPTPVEACLARIKEASDFPALSRQIIDTISVIDDDATSVQRLANVVLREYSLTLGVVRAANTTHYRRTARPVQSATHAMMMLGARTVRNLASSLLLFENYSKRSPVLKDLMVMSLVTANHAREVASRLACGDPEEAHLAGMFRNLGEVLVACHLPADYARIQQRVIEQGQSVSSATNAILGFRYEELAIAMSRHWGMPDTIVHGMRARAGAVSSDASAIIAFSHELTLAIYRTPAVAKDAPPIDTERVVRELVERYSPHLRISMEQVREVVEAALDETRELFVSSRVPMERRQLKQLADAARCALGLAVTPTGEWEIVSAGPADAPGSPTLRRRLRQELESKVDPASGADVAEVLLLALEAAMRGAPFDRVVAFVMSPDHATLSARSGLGVGVEALIAKFNTPAMQRDSAVLALLLRQATYLPSDRAMSVPEAAWANQAGVTQFGVFPIVAENVIVGCLYCDRIGRQALPDKLVMDYVRSLCVPVVRAIAARRKAVPAVAVPARAALSLDVKSALVMRVLRGETVHAVAESAGVPFTELEGWHAAFLAGAVERLSASPS